MSEIVLNPDRWLVCSATVEASILGPWADEYGAASLLGLRIRNSLLEHATVQSVPDRLRELTQQDCGTVHILVERMGADEKALVSAIESIDLPMRLHVWQRGPLAVVGALGAPEESVLESWQATRQIPHITSVKGDFPASFSDEYQSALRRWAEDARADFPEEMATLYDPELPSASTLTDVIRALKVAAAATLAAGTATLLGPARNAVRISSIAASGPESIGMPDYSAGSSGLSTGFASRPSNEVPVMTFSLLQGLSLVAPRPGYQDEPDVQLVADAPVADMADISRVVVRLIGAQATGSIEFAGEAGSLEWAPDIDKGCFVSQQVEYTPEFEALLTDPGLVFEVTIIRGPEGTKDE